MAAHDKESFLESALDNLKKKFFDTVEKNRFLKIVWETGFGFYNDDCFTFTAAISFYFLLSFIPFLILLGASVGYIVDYIKDIVVICKAYSSAVGAGAFVSEILDETVASELREHGGDKGEFGATTGRPRRMGWFDCVATRYGCEVQGATEVVLTALDCLSYLEKISLCVGYEIDGVVTKDFPVTPLLKKAKPVLVTMDGWHCDIRGIKEFDKLPQQAQDYVNFIEQEIGVKIAYVSNGPKREEIIKK